jgi:hypothetical protein
VGIIDFINRNRQTGTTTALVRCMDTYVGYLIVGSEYEVDRIKDKYSHLKDNVFSIRKVIEGGCRGLSSGKVFFDTTAVSEILLRQEELVRITKEALEELENVKENNLNDLYYTSINLNKKFEQWSKK